MRNHVFCSLVVARSMRSIKNNQSNHCNGYSKLCATIDLHRHVIRRPERARQALLLVEL
jgi:cob(I)alamin adenosyltransferase